MLAFDGVVEVVVFDEDLPHRILAVHILAVSLHEDCLPLGGIVCFCVLALGQFISRAHHKIQPPDLRCAAGNPDIPGLEFARKARHPRIIDHVVLFIDERHRTDLSYEFHVKFHTDSCITGAFSAQTDCG